MSAAAPARWVCLLQPQHARWVCLLQPQQWPACKVGVSAAAPARWVRLLRSSSNLLAQVMKTLVLLLVAGLIACSDRPRPRVGGGSAVYSEDGSVVSIENGVVRLGVDLDKGCSVVEFTDLSSNVNTINSADLGREVQPSFYSGPRPYDGCVWNGQQWPWNPIGSGDVHGHPSKVLAHRSTSEAIRCTIIPKQWACDNVDCECTFDLSYSLKQSMAYGSVTLHNNRSDKTDYGRSSQELPAVYVNGFLYRLFAYTGAQPWTNAPLTEYNASFANKFWVPGFIKPTEQFAMFAASQDFAVGVYQSGKDVDSFIAGFSGKKGSGGPSDGSTGYMAPSGSVDILYNTTYSYEYVLLMGTMETVRALAYSLHKQEEAGVSLSDYFNT